MGSPSDGFLDVVVFTTAAEYYLGAGVEKLLYVVMASLDFLSMISFAILSEVWKR